MVKYERMCNRNDIIIELFSCDDFNCNMHTSITHNCACRFDMTADVFHKRYNSHASRKTLPRAVQMVIDEIPYAQYACAEEHKEYRFIILRLLAKHCVWFSGVRARAGIFLCVGITVKKDRDAENAGVQFDYNYSSGAAQRTDVADRRSLRQPLIFTYNNYKGSFFMHHCSCKLIDKSKL